MAELRKRADYLKKKVYLGNIYRNFTGIMTKGKEGSDEVVCFTADNGQRVLELDGLEQKVKASRACQLVVQDPNEEFIKKFILPCLRDGAIYKMKYLLGTSMARLVIVRAMVDVAKEVGVDVVDHGCTGKGDDQVHFEFTLFALIRELMVLVPWREYELAGREDAIEYVKSHQVPIQKKSVYNRDRNLWHRSHGRDILEESENEPKKDMFKISIDPKKAPKEPKYLKIGIVEGLLVSENRNELSPTSLVILFKEFGREHGSDRGHMDEKVVAFVLTELITVPLAVKMKFLASLAYRVFDGGGMDRAIHMDAPLEDALLTATPSLECSLYECAIMQRYNMSLVDASWDLAGESMVVEGE